VTSNITTRAILHEVRTVNELIIPPIPQVVEPSVDLMVAAAA
jgi:hypothetical protein